MRGVLKTGLVMAVSVAALFAVAPAHADLIIKADGLTYDLAESLASNVGNFSLTITGINSAGDTEGGRSGVQAIAFNTATGFSSAAFGTSSLGTFTEKAGGLSSAGCDGSGGFFCFNNNITVPFSPSLAAGSTETFSFTETLGAGDTFASYVPHLKITWVGSKSKHNEDGKLTGGYDLVSQDFTGTTTTTSVPEPASLALFGVGLLGFGWLTRRRA